MTKICSMCKKEKTLDLFIKRSDRKSGYTSMCKGCKNSKYKPTNEQAKQYKATWVEKNPERHKEIKRNWHNKNADAINEQRRKKRKEDPLKIRESETIAKQRRRAKRRENGFELYSFEQFINLYGFTCHICKEAIDPSASRKAGDAGWERGLHIDHVVPLSKGGPDTLENVRPAHGLCNMKKGNVLP